uniref:Cell division cycle associated 8 n=1 Tax=Hippocampus comes TaxID=109280 RepID=A0A3Q2YYT9_HIPCM
SGRKRPTKQGKKTPKMVKLEAFLDDFDSEVKTRLGQLQERKNQMLRDLRNSYNVALIKLPANVRKMTWMEHFSKCSTSICHICSQRQEEAAIVENVVAEDHAVLMKAVKKSMIGKTSRKPPTTSKRARALSVSQQNAPITRSSRNPVVTPARTLLDSSLMGPTPLITPRFDPRLPKTPAVRVPRHKERVFSISVNGSPISADNEEIVINVPVGNGESIQLLASQVDSVDLSMLGETALRSIRRLQVVYRHHIWMMLG